jgi:hypothetical protein
MPPDAGVLSLGERLGVVGLCGVGTLVVLSLLSRKKLTFPFALVWLVVFALVGVGAALLPLAAALLEPLGRDALHTGGALAVLGLVGVLLYLSVRVSVLLHRFDELAQRVGLIEFDLREQIEQAKGETPKR